VAEGGSDAGRQEGERAAAATRIQSVQRGRVARQRVEALKASRAPQQRPAVASAADEGDVGATVDTVVDEAAETAVAAPELIQQPAAPELDAGECTSVMSNFSAEFRDRARKKQRSMGRVEQGTSPWLRQRGVSRAGMELGIAAPELEVQRLTKELAASEASRAELEDMLLRIEKHYRKEQATRRQVEEAAREAADAAEADLSELEAALQRVGLTPTHNSQAHKLASHRSQLVPPHPTQPAQCWSNVRHSRHTRR
jgi:chromosome segregation ATPase